VRPAGRTERRAGRGGLPPLDVARPYHPAVSGGWDDDAQGAATPASSGPSPAHTGRPPRSGRHRVATVVTTAAVATAVAALVAAVVSWQRGARWEDVADDRAERLSAIEVHVTEVEALRDDAEARLDALAAEKALAEDERATALARQQQLAELTELATRVANDLEACVVGTSDLLDVVGRMADFDRQEVVEFAAQVDGVCSQALAGNRALQQAAADLRA
jgi:hypothetical protein